MSPQSLQQTIAQLKRDGDHWLEGSFWAGPHDVQRAADAALAAADVEFPAAVQELVPMSPVHALAVLEVSSSSRLGSLGVETIAALMRQEDTDLRLATMAVLGRRGRGAESGDLGWSESLELRKARRYVRSRLEGPMRFPAIDPAEVLLDAKILEQECTCNYCGILIVKQVVDPSRFFWYGRTGLLGHECPETPPEQWPLTARLAESYRAPVVVSQGTKKLEPTWPKWMLEAGGWSKPDMEAFEAKISMALPMIDSGLVYEAVTVLSSPVGPAQQIRDLSWQPLLPSSPPTYSEPRKGFRARPGTRQADPENEPWPAKVRGSWRLDQRKSKK